MSAKSDEVVRCQRYTQVVEAARTRSRFTMAEIKQACELEKPAFVARVIHALEKDGVLKRTPAYSREACADHQTEKDSDGGSSAGAASPYTGTAARVEFRGNTVRKVHQNVHATGQDIGQERHPAKDPIGNQRLREEIVQWLVDPRQFSASQWLDQRITGHRLHRLPTHERPRERLMAQGSVSMRTAELLAILIRSGRPGESALEAGEAIARHFANCLENLSQAGPGELKTISATIGKTAFCQIAAGIELGRRIARARAATEEAPLPPRLTSPEGAIAYCQDHFQQLVEEGAQEEFHIVTLDTKLRPLHSHRVSVGLLDQAMIHPREVFRPAIRDAAKAILLVHNHPSGDPEPSAADLSATRQLESAGQVVGIEVIDHLVVAREGVVSLRQRRKAG